MPGTVTLTVNYNTDTGAVTSITEDSNYITTSGSTVTVKNRPAVNINFNKKDFNGKLLSGATISVSGSTGVSSLSTSTLTSNANGSFGTITVYPTDNSYNTGTFEIKVTETGAPTGYQKMPGTVTLTVRYDVNTGDVISISEYSDYIDIATNKTVTIKNQPKLTSLKIIKTDAWQTNSNGLLRIPGVKFKIELTGVESIKGHSGTPSIITETTDGSGEIVLEDVVLKKDATQITAKIIEISVPDRDTHNSQKGYYYIKDETPINMTITYSNGSWSSEVPEVNGTSISCDRQTASKSASESNFSVTIKNQPYIEFSGLVWKDGQTGVKENPHPANGYRDKENNGNYAEELYKGALVQVKHNTSGNPLATYLAATDKKQAGIVARDGTYEFKDIPKTANGYIIEFHYDGINYIATEKDKDNNTKDSIDSDAIEIGRTEFNNKFKTIKNGMAQNVNGQDSQALTYKYNEQNTTSKLMVSPVGHVLYEDGKLDDEGHVSSWGSEYSMTARTDEYTQSTYNINLGLVKKELDLALTTNIEDAEVTINGAKTKYTEFAGPITIDNQPSSESGSDNLYLYSSDYNYRKSDYVTDKINNNVNPDNIQGSQIAGDEIEVFVTYKVSLINQTSFNASVDKFVYYYDSRYTLLENESNLNGYKINSNTNNIIEFEKVNKNEYMQDRIELTLKFKVNIDNVTTNASDYGNAGEITQYSTEIGGLIDKDSAPGNANITRNAEGKAVVNNDEDDSDQAKGLNIQIKEDKIRKISGKVFKDTDKNGNNNENSSIEGVVVQLIEIKKIGGQYYEYIWQEETTNSDGYYEFTNFIPSGGNANKNGVINYNYIVRFIYGDGAAYDLTPNTTEYNGQDYKSTKDVNYTKTWYNQSNYNSNASVARDNEARRLEVMAHSTIIDGKMGTALTIFTKNIEFTELTNGQKYYIVGYYNSVVKPQYESVKNAVEETDPDNYLVAKRIRNIFGNTLPDITTENLNEDLYNKMKKYVSFRTWMCAETSRINIQVDADDKTQIGSTQVSSSNQILEFNNINLGLALRPQENIVLEKHITALKITPSGTGVQSIVDAKALDIEKIVNGTEVEVQGVTTGLATIKSTADNRGFWQVATDVEELMQGADLEVEYTYVIRNDSEEDYLTNFLIEQYEQGIDNGNYVKTLNNKSAEVKVNTKGQTEKYGSYLGQFYYLGERGNNDALVSSKVYKFEEALNNDLTFDGTEALYFDIKEQQVDRNVYGVNKADGAKKVKIDTVIQNKTVTPFLVPTLGNPHRTTTETEKGTADWSRTITLKTTLSTVAGGELGANLPSYIAEILRYSNAAGRKDMTAVPANLSYVHSDDTNMTIEKDNEQDEFWAESIIITKPTGEDKITPIQIAIITISSLAVIGAGIVLIKKFVLNK